MIITICSPLTEAEIKAYYTLRWKILREPWGQPPGSEKDALENECLHFTAVTQSKIIVGVSRLYLEPTNTTASIRYMAVDPQYQKTGIGSLLLNALEVQARNLGATKITLNARSLIIDFYTKHQYKDLGSSHTLYDVIEHRKMDKVL